MGLTNAAYYFDSYPWTICYYYHHRYFTSCITTPVSRFVVMWRAFFPRRRFAKGHFKICHLAQLLINRALVIAAAEIVSVKPLCMARCACWWRVARHFFVSRWSCHGCSSSAKTVETLISKCHICLAVTSSRTVMLAGQSTRLWNEHEPMLIDMGGVQREREPKGPILLRTKKAAALVVIIWGCWQNSLWRTETTVLNCYAVHAWIIIKNHWALFMDVMLLSSKLNTWIIVHCQRCTKW